MRKMKLTDKKIKEILEKYKDVFNALEEYDRTGKLPESVIKRLKNKKRQANLKNN